jgi:ATP-dependent DNA helicase PIF1
MRSVIAVIASVLFLGIGWLLVGGIFGLLGWVLVKTGYASAPVLLIHLFLMWIFSPGFAAAIAIAATSSIFKSVSPSTIYVGFISACATALFLLALTSYRHDQALGTIVVSLFQAVAIFFGARIGSSLSSPLGRDQNAPELPTEIRYKPTNDPTKGIPEPPTVAAEPKIEPPKPDRPDGPRPPDRQTGTRVGIEVTNEFQAAVEFVNQRRGNLFITGRAGTGKSTLLRLLRDIRKSNIAVLAPTGLAAVNVGGQTIHSFFKFKPGLLRPEDIRIGRNAATYRNLETIIIDEISMVRADLMEAIDRSLRINRGRLREPFGGVQVILVGDLHQLPPVVDDSEIERYLHGQFGGVYFFNASVFRASQLRYSELTKKFRQSDPLFAGILDRIAEGTYDGDDLSVLNENVTNIEQISRNGQFVILAPRNRTVFDLNMRFLNALAGSEEEMVALVEGDFDASSFPTDQSLRLKVGAKVVLLRNDSRKRWVNGTMATVARLDNGRVWIALRGAEHELEREVWEKIKYEYDEERKTIVGKAIGSFRQFPLRLAWALTIHKSQGMTLENTYLDLDGGSFVHGQTYVALSRSRSLSGLRLARPLRASDVIFDPAAVGYRSLCRPVSQ